jgi:3-deoxy-D-manno-octulosonic-acid transferase
VADALDALPGRPLLIVAPRHEDGRGAARRALGGSGFSISERDEGERNSTALPDWMAAVAAREGRRVGLLATKGELPDAYALAKLAIIGGTFAPFGGHNALEAAARGCPVIVGPHHGEIATSVTALVHEGAAAIARNEAEAVALAVSWTIDGKARERSAAAVRVAARAGGAARRALDALLAWGLAP